MDFVETLLSFLFLLLALKLNYPFHRYKVLFVRNFLLLFPGLSLWFIVVVLSNKSGFFLHELQNTTNANHILFVSSLGTIASSIGWRLGMYNKALASLPSINFNIARKEVFYSAVLLALIFGYLSGLNRVNVLTQSHDVDNVVAGTGMFTFLSVAMFALAFYLRKSKMEDKVLVLSLLIIVFAFFLMKGRRLEVISLIFVFIAYSEMNMLRLLKFKYLVFSIFAFVFLGFWGYARNDIGGAVDSFLVNQAFFLSNSLEAISLPAISNISLTLLLVTEEVKNGLEFLLGSSYLDWIPRTLPSFVYADRPTPVSSNYTLQGGLHELAEAYLNFGLIGVFIIPFVISYFGGTLQSSTLKSGQFSKVIYLVFAGALMRGVWYQSFTLYKSILFASLLVFIIYSVSKLLFPFSKRVR